ncbi:MAG: hypothetical protein BWK80_15190 [Desulfobacteraceae bacterium IS3]|nr:MAG: hypothetical protein BWK80_15190 [Desulfobacteraceae bacterium IS3]
MGLIKPGCLLDSNIPIYHINGQLDEHGEQLFSDMMKAGAYISVISRIEILGWQGHTKDSLTVTRDLLQRLIEYPLTSPIAEICISIRQNYRVKLPDVIIAATALYLNLPLMTRNVKDFSLIPDLKLMNPFD